MKQSTSPKMLAIKMQSTSAFRQALKPSVVFFGFFIIFLRLGVDTFFRHRPLSGWLEYLKSQLDPVVKAVPVGADWSLIYTVQIFSGDCVRSSFSFSV